MSDRVQRVHCRSCGVVIVWAKTRNGKFIPIETTAVANGNIALSKEGTKLVADYVDEAFSGQRFISHFVSCPSAKEWRKKYE